MKLLSGGPSLATSRDQSVFLILHGRIATQSARGGGGMVGGLSGGLNGLNGWNGWNPGWFTVAVFVFFVSGCDPILNIGGTFFPGWMVAILIGSALTVAIRYIFVFTRLEPHVGPLALIYTSLGVLLSVVSWLILYRS